MTETTAPDALMPCPFCGDNQDSFAGLYPGAFARCEQSFIVNCCCGAMSPAGETMLEAIAAWNRRAGQAHAAGLLEALEFYADPQAWNQPPVEMVAGEFGPAYRNKASEMQKDRGKRARAAIAAAKGADQ